MQSVATILGIISAAIGVFALIKGIKISWNIRRTEVSSSIKEIDKEKDISFSLLKRILLFSAGIRLDIVKWVKGDINILSFLGYSILVSALTSAISVHYLFYFFFQSNYSAFVFSASWGIMFFITDRYLISSMKKNRNLYYDFALAAPRLILSVILGFSVAIPLMTVLFEGSIMLELDQEIDATLLKKYNLEVKSLQGFENDLDSLESIYSYLRDTEISLISSLAEYGRKKSGELTYSEISFFTDSMQQLAYQARSVLDSIETMNIQKDQLASYLEDASIYEHKALQASFITKLEIVERVISLNIEFKIMYFFCTILVISLTIMPILSRFITPKTRYDHLAEVAEFKYREFQMKDLKSKIDSFNEETK